MTDSFSNVTRVEVIDNNGRSYTKNWVDKVEMQLQDDRRREVEKCNILRIKFAE